jgi:FAD/FMN-containing dehydrogenase
MLFVPPAASAVRGSVGVGGGAKGEDDGKGAVPSENSAQVIISRRLREGFDPHGIFNPGRMPAAL